MSFDLGAIGAKVTLDTAEYRRGMDGLPGIAENNFRKIAAAAAAYLSARQLFRFGKAAVDEFSALEEAANKFKNTFSGIPQLAARTAEDLQKSFELPRQSALEMLAGTGDLLTGFGFAQESALELADAASRLGVDLASYQNYAGGAQAATEALTKGMLGETENLKALGIVVRQDSEEFKTLTKAFRSGGLSVAEFNRLFGEGSKEYNRAVEQFRNARGLTEQQAVAMAVLAISTRQSMNAIGDYNRPGDTLAQTQMRIASSTRTATAAIGEHLAKAVHPALRAYNDLLVSFNNLDESARNSLVNAALLTAGIVGLKTATATAATTALLYAKLRRDMIAAAAGEAAATGKVTAAVNQQTAAFAANAAARKAAGAVNLPAGGMLNWNELRRNDVQQRWDARRASRSARRAATLSMDAEDAVLARRMFGGGASVSGFERRNTRLDDTFRTVGAAAGNTAPQMKNLAEGINAAGKSGRTLRDTLRKTTASWNGFAGGLNRDMGKLMTTMTGGMTGLSGALTAAGNAAAAMGVAVAGWEFGKYLGEATGFNRWLEKNWTLMTTGVDIDELDRKNREEIEARKKRLEEQDKAAREAAARRETIERRNEELEKHRTGYAEIMFQYQLGMAEDEEKLVMLRKRCSELSVQYSRAEMKDKNAILQEQLRLVESGRQISENLEREQENFRKGWRDFTLSLREQEFDRRIDGLTESGNIEEAKRLLRAVADKALSDIYRYRDLYENAKTAKERERAEELMREEMGRYRKYESEAYRQEKQRRSAGNAVGNFSAELFFRQTGGSELDRNAGEIASNTRETNGKLDNIYSRMEKNNRNQPGRYS